MKKGARLARKEAYPMWSARHRWSGDSLQRCLNRGCIITRSGVGWNRRRGYKTTCPTSIGLPRPTGASV